MTPDPDINADYIIIGAGSSGCVIANHLSRKSQASILLLEAGGDDRPLHNPRQFTSNMNIRLPAGFTRLLGDSKVIWNYTSAPDKTCAGRSQAFTSGKVLGGSSSINGLMYVRGFPSDYDGWRSLGCDGWGWDDVLPLFRRFENTENRQSQLFGVGGALNVAEFPQSYPAADAFIRACIEAGLPETTNINGEVQEGACYTRQTTRNGLRHSAADAYLRIARKRPNLRIETDAVATRIVLEGNEARRVEFRQHGKLVSALAHKEIILCCGAINSPRLLQLSGLGPGELLRSVGVPVVADLPAVGRNLQDHLTMRLQLCLREDVPSLNHLASGVPLFREMLKFAFLRRGLLANSVGTVTGYLRSSPDVAIPDVQFVASPASVDDARTVESGHTVLNKQPGFTLGGYLARPESRGSVEISTSDAFAPPVIQTNYMSTPGDQAATIAMVRALRRLLKQPSMADLIDHEIFGNEASKRDDDAAILSFVQQTGFTAYHPVGTCRMGSDLGSVTDPQLRVRGIRNLRVADASIMPRLVSGNTNAACIMIGEKASDLIAANS